MRKMGKGLTTLLLGSVLLLTACSSSSQNVSATSSKLPEINMVVFQPPSLGAFLPPIIQQEKLDEKNGIHINFSKMDTDAYNNAFAAGQFPVGGSAALLSEANRINKGVKVTYLFNLFDFWGTLVSSDNSIKTLKDLQNKNIAAAKSTTNYAMFDFFAKKEGVDLGKMSVQNAGTAALNTYASADRADGVQLWEPGYSTLISKNPGKFHQVDFGLNKWKEYTGTDKIPYLGVAAQQDWVDKNKNLIPKLYKTYLDAANWVKTHPSEAAAIIAKQIPGGSAKVIEDLIKNNDRLGMDVTPASAVENDIKSVFKAGMETNYLTKMPEDSVIYKGKID